MLIEKGFFKNVGIIFSPPLLFCVHHVPGVVMWGGQMVPGAPCLVTRSILQEAAAAKSLDTLTS